MATSGEVRDGFVKDVSKLVSGTTIAQFIGIAISPLLTRIYAAETFGTLTLFVSATTVLSVISCLRYDQALMLSENEEDASNMLSLALLVAMISSLLLGITLFFLIRLNVVTLWPSLSVSSLLVVALPFTVFAMGANLALTNWNSRSRKFGRLSLVAVARILITAVIQIGGGLAGYATTKSLIGANIAGILAGICYLGWLIYREDGQQILRQFSFVKIVQLAGRYRNFALVDIWSALLNSLSWQLPAFLLAFYFSTAITGYYGLAFRVLAVPMGVIGAAVGQVFFQRGAVASKSGDLAVVLENVIAQLAILAMLPMAVVAVAGRDLFAVVFGAEWSEAGLYAQLLSVWTFFWFITSPISTVFGILEHQKDFFVINLIIFLSRLIALWLGGFAHEPIFAIALYSIAGVLAYGGEVYWAARLTNVSFGAILRRLQPYFYLSAVLIAGLVLSYLFVMPQFLRMLFSCVVLIIYALFVGMHEFALNQLFSRLSGKQIA